jgi:hypothetical protein
MPAKNLLENNQSLWILDDLATKIQETSPESTVKEFKHAFPFLTNELVNELKDKEYELRREVTKSGKEANLVDFSEALMIFNPKLTANDIVSMLKLLDTSFASSPTLESFQINNMSVNPNLIHDSIDIEELKKTYNPCDIYFFNEISFNYSVYNLTVTLTANIDCTDIFQPLIISNLNTHSFNYHPFGFNNLIHFKLYLERLNCYLMAKNKSILLIIPGALYTNFDNFQFIQPYYIKKLNNNSFDVNTWISDKLSKVLKTYICKFQSKQDVIIRSILQEFENCLMELKNSPMFSRLYQLKSINSQINNSTDNSKENQADSLINVIRDACSINVLFDKFLNQDSTNDSLDEILNFVIYSLYPYILKNAKSLEKSTLDILLFLLEKHDKFINKQASLIDKSHQSIISLLISRAIEENTDTVKQNGESMIDSKKRSFETCNDSENKAKRTKLNNIHKSNSVSSKSIECHSKCENESDLVTKNIKMQSASNSSSNSNDEALPDKFNSDKVNEQKRFDSISSKVSQHERPIFTYAELIGMAMVDKLKKSLTKNEIIEWIKTKYEYFNNGDDKWQKNVRKSLNKNFIRNETGSNILWSMKEQDYNKYDNLYKEMYQLGGDDKKCSDKSPLLTLVKSSPLKQSDVSTTSALGVHSNSSTPSIPSTPSKPTTQSNPPNQVNEKKLSTSSTSTTETHKNQPKIIDVNISAKPISNATKKNSIESTGATLTTLKPEVVVVVAETEKQNNKKCKPITGVITVKSQVPTKTKNINNKIRKINKFEGNKVFQEVNPINPLDRIPRLNKLKLPSTTIETKKSFKLPNQTLQLFSDDIDSDHFETSDDETE